MLVALSCALTVAACGGGSEGATAQEAANRARPTIVVPDAPAPKKLVVEDLVEGAGPAAKEGDRLAVHYVGVNYETGEQFEASRRDLPFPFRLGVGEVVEGWDRGLVGMREGGRRQLTVPPDLAYEADPLIYVIDLVSVE